MADKIWHDEFCARGGRSRSALKMEAARNNLEKAKAALAAAFVGGRASARSFCSFRRAAPAFLLCIANPLVVRAEQLFERAGVTKAINAVSVLPRNTKAVPGDVITKDLALKTGGDSRAELEFPDLTITRVGANALFRFLAGTRQIILDGGTMLFHAPKGAGGGKVEAGAITAAVTGTDFLISNINKRVKVICLSGKVLVYITANPKEGRGLKPGQMADVAAGATKIPAATTVNLTTLLATSMLGEAGGLGPFPNQAAIEKNARNQQDASLLGRFSPGLNNLLTQPGSLPAQTMTTQAGQAARSITTANNIASQQLAAQQAAAQQAAAQQAAAQQAAAQQAAAQQAAAQQAAAQQAAAQQAAAQQAAAQQAAAQQAAAQQAAAQQAAAQQAAAQQQATAGVNQGNNGNRGNQGNAFGRGQGNQGQGQGQGNQGQGNQGQGQGNQGQPPGQNK
jgi:ferric-dicitrate binding protein FerR (iron transport regulator)